jgi:hypothetical protein
MQKRLKVESLGFSFFQHSNTPVLQNLLTFLPAKPLKLELAHRTRFSLLKYIKPPRSQSTSTATKFEIPNPQQQMWDVRYVV